MCKQTGGRPLCDGSHNKVARDSEGHLLPYRTALDQSSDSSSAPLVCQRRVTNALAS
jgi:CDGSH-type Zn-finger protein